MSFLRLKVRWGKPGFVFAELTPTPPSSPPPPLPPLTRAPAALTPGTAALLENKRHGGSGYRGPIDALRGVALPGGLSIFAWPIAIIITLPQPTPLIAYLLNKTSAFLLTDRSPFLCPPLQHKSEGNKASWGVFEKSEVTGERCAMIPNKLGPPRCFYLRHLKNRPPAAASGRVCPRMLQFHLSLLRCVIWPKTTFRCPLFDRVTQSVPLLWGLDSFQQSQHIIWLPKIQNSPETNLWLKKWQKLAFCT